MQDSPFIATVLFGPDGPRSKAVEDDKPLSADGPRSVRPRSHNEALQKNECTVETASVSAASCRDEEAWSANLITAVWRRLFRRPVSTWYPTFWQIHPLSGLAALAVTAGCIVAALLILINSDGQPVSGTCAFLRRTLSHCLPGNRHPLDRRLASAAHSLPRRRHGHSERRSCFCSL